MIYPTRVEAGRRLAAALRTRMPSEAVVLVMHSNAMRLGFEIASASAVPLDVLLVGRLQVPGRPGPVGVVTAHGSVLNPARVRDLPAPYLDGLIRLEQAELERRSHRYRGSVGPVRLTGRLVVLADDGSAAPSEVSAALEAARKGGASRLVFASPCCSARVAEVARSRADEVVVLGAQNRRATPLCHEDFAQITEDDARELIEFSRRAGLARPGPIEPPARPLAGSSHGVRAARTEYASKD